MYIQVLCCQNDLGMDSEIKLNFLFYSGNGLSKLIQDNLQAAFEIHNFYGYRVLP